MKTAIIVKQNNRLKLFYFLGILVNNRIVLFTKDIFYIYFSNKSNLRINNLTSGWLKRMIWPRKNHPWKIIFFTWDDYFYFSYVTINFVKMLVNYNWSNLFTRLPINRLVDATRWGHCLKLVLNQNLFAWFWLNEFHHAVDSRQAKYLDYVRL